MKLNDQFFSIPHSPPAAGLGHWYQLGLERHRCGSGFVLSGLCVSLCVPGLFYPPHSFLSLLGQLSPKKAITCVWLALAPINSSCLLHMTSYLSQMAPYSSGYSFPFVLLNSFPKRFPGLYFFWAWLCQEQEEKGIVCSDYRCTGLSRTNFGRSQPANTRCLSQHFSWCLLIFLQRVIFLGGVLEVLPLPRGHTQVCSIKGKQKMPTLHQSSSCRAKEESPFSCFYSEKNFLETLEAFVLVIATLYTLESS